MADIPEVYYFADLIEHNTKERGDRVYIHFEDEKITYAQFDQMTCRAANGLKAQGAKPGDGVAILMGNCPEYLYLFY
jgi:acyl-CoA synthetase (AMP-forming)/AMP-acid ligase II